MGVGAATGAGYGENSALRLNQRKRLSGSRLGDARRHRRTAHPEASEGLQLPELLGAAWHGREGAHRGHMRSRVLKAFNVVDQRCDP